MTDDSRPSSPRGETGADAKTKIVVEQNFHHPANWCSPGDCPGHLMRLSYSVKGQGATFRVDGQTPRMFDLAELRTLRDLIAALASHRIDDRLLSEPGATRSIID